ncbi:uncharacterized protein LOC129766557 [Toxorhynchites rutilus septentrionalis]|uniref:uncharacterized protein LOC129766557 n=1 Tax=Toxorhynchites rutilus septentrionalis TaxID=329112 RepID=UPI002479DC90|nr:uncharacterized protein LOC129766557 [Toxorhynchites rutilus septentrionalis]
MEFPCTEHLSLEETDYELRIRNQLGENIVGLDLLGKQRRLRKLFKSDAKSGRKYSSSINIRDELNVLEKNVAAIGREVKQKGFESNHKSKLLHYLYRTERCTVNDEGEQLLKDGVLRCLGKMIKEYDADKLSDEAKNDCTNVNAKIDAECPVDFVPQETETEQQEINVLQEIAQLRGKVEYLERTLSDLMSRLAIKETTNQISIPIHNVEGNTSNENVESDSEDNELDSGQNRFSQQQNESRRNANGDDSELSVNLQPSSINSSRQRRRKERHSGELDRRDYISERIGKWRMKFTGQPRTLSVENFLYKLEKIAYREDVSAKDILKRIHVLLDGSALEWFFTYVDELNDWDSFERRIRNRFGNPNYDQAIRQNIFDRKQRRDETFVAFVEGIEQLNKMLSKPLSKRRKFEIIFDNMRQHYRSRISIIDVNDLDHLMDLNYRIDATDSALQKAWESSTLKPIHCIETMESRNEEANWIVDRRRTRNSSTTKTCWNCQQQGHCWRNCNERKLIFCYGCGNMGRTTRSCERCTVHNRNERNLDNNVLTQGRRRDR